MKKNRAQMEAEFLAEAKELFDELMDWDDENEAPNLTQIEEVILELRKRFGERMAEKLLRRQELRQPAERVYCERCGDEMQPKGLKGSQVETRVGHLQIERAHYYCPRCQLGLFPPGSATDDLGETVE
jgi:hypothetical protein